MIDRRIDGSRSINDTLILPAREEERGVNGARRGRNDLGIKTPTFPRALTGARSELVGAGNASARLAPDAMTESICKGATTMDRQSSQQKQLGSSRRATRRRPRKNGPAFLRFITAIIAASRTRDRSMHIA
jgi:hypothetical protein